jgi:hypothetical protein
MTVPQSVIIFGPTGPVGSSAALSAYQEGATYKTVLSTVEIFIAIVSQDDD